MVVYSQQSSNGTAASSAAPGPSAANPPRALNPNYDLPPELVQVLVNQQSEQRQNPQPQTRRSHQDQDWINAYRRGQQ